MLFTDYYAQQSCTAGRAAFITGQHPFRTGLLTVGLPGSPLGLQAEDPTIADLLREQGYVTGQFGKNHLGDLNKFLPTVHGFDEFFGNLYHLNAEEEPEDPQYPHNIEGFYERFGPRGNLSWVATDSDDLTEDPRFGPVGKQSCIDTGPVTRKRMETIENELLEKSFAFIEKAHDAGKPFFVWRNMLRMHVWTRLSEQWKDKTRLGPYADGMQEVDWVVGELLKKLDDLGRRQHDCRVFFRQRRGEVHVARRRHQSVHGEKDETWEGGFRVPTVVRWPGVIERGSASNEIFSYEDWLPTLLAAAGDPAIVEKLKKGHRANGKSFKVHAEGVQINRIAGVRELLVKQLSPYEAISHPRRTTRTTAPPNCCCPLPTAARASLGYNYETTLIAGPQRVALGDCRATVCQWTRQHSLKNTSVAQICRHDRGFEVSQKRFVSRLQYRPGGTGPGFAAEGTNLHPKTDGGGLSCQRSGW